jgi:hypothetical protein
MSFGNVCHCLNYVIWSCCVRLCHLVMVPLCELLVLLCKTMTCGHAVWNYVRLCHLVFFKCKDCRDPSRISTTLFYYLQRLLRPLEDLDNSILLLAKVAETPRGSRQLHFITCKGSWDLSRISTTLFYYLQRLPRPLEDLDNPILLSAKVAETPRGSRQLYF